MNKARFNLKNMIICAMLSALSIILGKYLAINIGDSFRISLESLPIIFGGVFLGAVPAMLIAFVADIVGCIMVGYTINPIITLGAMLIGFISAVAYRLCKRYAIREPLVIAIAVGGAHLIGSVIVKTIGLSIFYDTPLIVLMALRLLNYALVALAEGLTLYLLSRNTMLRREIAKFLEEK